MMNSSSSFVSSVIYSDEDLFNCINLQSTENNGSCPYTWDIAYFLRSNENCSQLVLSFPCEVREYLFQIDWLVRLVKFLFGYVSLVMVITGLLLNTLSFIVLRAPALEACNLSIYLRALAISDNGVLIFHVFLSSVRAKSEDINKIFLENSWICFLGNILNSFFFIFSSWLIVSLTYERLWVLRFPLNNSLIFKRKSAQVIVATITLFCLILGLVRGLLHGFEQQNMYGYRSCRAHGRLSKELFVYIFAVTWIPLLLIILGNSYLLMYLKKAARKRANLTKQNFNNDLQTHKMTCLLLSVSAVYVILFIPIGTMACIDLYRKSGKIHPKLSAEYVEWKKQTILITVIRGICFFVYLWNFSINFFVYCISGVKFRMEAKVLLKKWLKCGFLKWIFCHELFMEKSSPEDQFDSKGKTLLKESSSTITFNMFLSESQDPYFSKISEKSQQISLNTICVTHL